MIRQGIDRTIDTRGGAFTATIDGTRSPTGLGPRSPSGTWLTTTVRRYGADREPDVGIVASLGDQVTATEVPHRGAEPDVRFALAGIPRSDWTHSVAEWTPRGRFVTGDTFVASLTR